MTLTFTSYVVRDDGVEFIFVSLDPGAGQPTNYSIFATDTELAPIAARPALLALVTNKLRRKLNAVGFASKLDPFIGQSITI